ncbi:MAG: DUF1549 domain-containing protein [Planctomycetaceae bacterium]
MTEHQSQPTELDTLIEALCEGTLSPAQAQRLERLVLNDASARQRYIAYLDLHGTLMWNAGIGSTHESHHTVRVSTTTAIAVHAPLLAAPARTSPAAAKRSRRLITTSLVASLIIVAAVVTLWVGRDAADPDRRQNMANSPNNENGLSPDVLPPDMSIAHDDASNKNRNIAPLDLPIVSPRSDSVPGVAASDAPNDSLPKTAAIPKTANGKIVPHRFGSVDRIVAFIDEQIEAGWDASGVKPSGKSGDSEWLRRVYLDIAGHIPPSDVAREFIDDKRPERQKREEMVNRLLDDSAYVRNFTTIWTNLLIGRSLSPNVNRPAMQKFLRDCFAHNRPWNEVVYEIVSAEGSPDQNGASAFLLAHLNNQALPATAITARLFLGTQVQCTQCHDHPSNDWKQNQFWEFNSFFQQTEVVQRESVDPRTGSKLMGPALHQSQQEGPNFYEDRRGLMKVAFPTFDGIKVDPSEATNRRLELARLMTDSSRPQLALAMVNRTWRHFLGEGFTSPVDDMGPHNTPTHPELLEGLSSEFVASGYDMKQLIRWICLTDAYQRSSQFNETNRIDDPEAGRPPMFSRVYPKEMSAEQLYDSLVVATKPQNQGRISWAADEPLRDQWMQQFVTDMGTDENDESNNFEGTISLALLMMNSDLMANALSLERGTYLSELVNDRMSEEQRLRLLCLSALSREPTDDEMKLWGKVLRDRLTDPNAVQNQELAMAQGLQDVFWAYLNSNEFVIVP